MSKIFTFDQHLYGVRPLCNGSNGTRRTKTGKRHRKGDFEFAKVKVSDLWRLFLAIRRTNLQSIRKGFEGSGKPEGDWRSVRVGKYYSAEPHLFFFIAIVIWEKQIYGSVEVLCAVCGAGANELELERTPFLRDFDWNGWLTVRDVIGFHCCSSRSTDFIDCLFNYWTALVTTSLLDS